MGLEHVCDGEIMSAKAYPTGSSKTIRASSIILFIGSPRYCSNMLTIDHLKGVAQGLFTSASDPKRTLVSLRRGFLWVGDYHCKVD